MVAQLRGATFTVDPADGLYISTDEATPIAYKALHDVARWLGFKGDEDDATGAYMDAMEEERRAIFKRASPGPTP